MRSTPSSPSPAELELAVSALTATCTRQIFWLEDELVKTGKAQYLAALSNPKC